MLLLECLLFDIQKLYQGKSFIHHDTVLLHTGVKRGDSLQAMNPADALSTPRISTSRARLARHIQVPPLNFKSHKASRNSTPRHTTPAGEEEEETGARPSVSATGKLMTAREFFLEQCSLQGIPPEPLIVRKMQSSVLDFSFFGLGDT